MVCLADWVLIEDFGFFGGLGTDPNSMIPFVLLTVAGYLALTRAPVTATEPASPGWSAAAAPRCSGGRASVRGALAAASIRSVGGAARSE